MAELLQGSLSSAVMVDRLFRTQGSKPMAIFHPEKLGRTITIRLFTGVSYVLTEVLFFAYKKRATLG